MKEDSCQGKGEQALAQEKEDWEGWEGDWTCPGGAGPGGGLDMTIGSPTPEIERTRKLNMARNDVVPG